MLRWAILCLVLVLAGPARADPFEVTWSKIQRHAEIPVLEVEKYRLPNGLTVILHPDRSVPEVAVNVTYYVGALHEPKGRSGFAHLFEHMMFEGGAGIRPGEFFRRLTERGARRINGVTSFDRTAYYETVPRNELEFALWVESDRMGFLLTSLSEASLEAQKLVVKNERRQQVIDRRYGLVDEFVIKTLYPAPHPYAGNVIGSLEHIEAATLAEMREFFATYYTPANACLVLAGDFDPKQAKLLVEKYFGALGGRPRPEFDPRRIDDSLPSKVVKIRAPVAKAPRVSVAWHGPFGFDLAAAELDVLSMVLMDPELNYLVGHMRSYGLDLVDLDVSFVEYLAGSRFRIDITLKPGTKLKTKEEIDNLMLAVNRISGVLERLPLPVELVEDARTRFERDMYFGLQSLQSRASILQYYEHIHGDPGALAKDMQRYRKVTAQGLRRAVQLTMRADRVVVIAVPKG